MLVSAHASYEELFLVRQFVTGWRRASRVDGCSVVAILRKAQPRDTFKVPPVDAPNVAGARAMGFLVPEGPRPRATSANSDPPSGLAR